jgi:hypothetical protein
MNFRNTYLMKRLTFLFLLNILTFNIFAQGGIWDPKLHCEVDPNGNCTPTTILTAMPFLRIAPDARGGAMGDAGIVADPSAASMHYNPSNIMFAKDESAVSLNFTPWLKALGLDDLYLSYLSGYKKLEANSAVGFNLRYFSLGSIFWTDANGGPNGEGRPREMEVGGAYIRKLGDNLSASISGKFLYSNLAGGQVVQGVSVKAATSFATDVSFTYRKKAKISNYNGKWAFGMNLSNLGAKVTYTDNADRDFIPTNLGIGGMLGIDFDDYNSLSFVLDVNKLLTPSPHSTSNPDWDLSPKNAIPDWKEKTLFQGVFGSFGDAQGGFSEELRELYYSAGVEYVYDKQFAVRGGYYYENPLKGARQFWTLGAGIKYNVFEFNLSYLAPRSIQRTPLDNTLRFGVNFNFKDFANSLSDE